MVKIYSFDLRIMKMVFPSTKAIVTVVIVDVKSYLSHLICLLMHFAFDVKILDISFRDFVAVAIINSQGNQFGCLRLDIFPVQLFYQLQ